jgi:hypothetical protein
MSKSDLHCHNIIIAAAAAAAAAATATQLQSVTTIQQWL